MNEQQEIIEEIIEEPEEVEEAIDSRLQKSVDVLKKLTKIDEKKLEGLTLEEQFDRLDFLADNLPKTRKVTRNKPIVPLPTDVDAPKFGRKVKDDQGGNFWLFNAKEWINFGNKK